MAALRSPGRAPDAKPHKQADNAPQQERDRAEENAADQFGGQNLSHDGKREDEGTWSGAERSKARNRCQRAKRNRRRQEIQHAKHSRAARLNPAADRCSGKSGQRQDASDTGKHNTRADHDPVRDAGLKPRLHGQVASDAQ
jgi:hypothetical protein